MTKGEGHIDRVWEVIYKAKICMMVTRFGGGLRARPLEARPDRDAEVIWFLTDKRGLKDDEIEADAKVCLTFVYPEDKVYLSITGKAFVGRDHERGPRRCGTKSSRSGGPAVQRIRTCW